MGKMYWIRAVIMGLILLAVLWSMRSLNHPNNPVSTLFSPQGQQTTTSILCPSRILWLELLEGPVHLEQQGTKWIRIRKGQKEELDGVAVEKWFSQFCMANVDLQPQTSEEATFSPALRLAYIARKPQTLSRSTNDIFEWQGRKLKSEELTKVLAQLPNLPLANPPGTPPPPEDGK